MKDILEGKVVDLYDVDITLAKTLSKYKLDQLTLYAREENKTKSNSMFLERPYGALLEAADCVADVCFLDNDAIKVLFAMYPSAPNYVLVRLSLNSSWLIGFIGLFRRLIAGFLKIEKISTIIDANEKKTWWLVLKQKGMLTKKTPLLPAKIGVLEFLNWLKKQKINYVILRFYEKLPKIYRYGGDIDILLSNEDKERVKTYLEENKHLLSSVSKDIRLGLHTVSGEKGSIPYYPPPLAKQILKNAIDGPSGSKIPSSRDALNSFIYHVLYHAKKGYSAGIPSSYKKHTEKYPENDYFSVIQKLKKNLSLEFPSKTMEDLDEYLDDQGWRPKLDTLAKMSETNAWVYDRFFSLKQKGPVGISVFMLREWILEKNLVHKIERRINDNNFLILRKKILSDIDKIKASDLLRGGSWGQNSDGTTSGWLPAVALIVVDIKCIKMLPAYAKGYEHYKIRSLKNILRTSFDDGERSALHSTDNAHESWEYIETCFPNDVEKIRKELDSLAKVSIFSKLAQFLSPTYFRHSLFYSLREYMIRKYLS